MKTHTIHVCMMKTISPTMTLMRIHSPVDTILAEPTTCIVDCTCINKATHAMTLLMTMHHHDAPPCTMTTSKIPFHITTTCHEHSRAMITHTVTLCIVTTHIMLPCTTNTHVKPTDIMMTPHTTLQYGTTMASYATNTTNYDDMVIVTSMTQAIMISLQLSILHNDCIGSL